jgi:hypothetical protein
MLSKREEFRVATTGKFAIHFIQERLEAGDIPRNDGFFSKEETGTSRAGEIFEGVLLRAKADHEERKAHFYGRLFANVAFDSTCSVAEANYLLRLMERLTFRQLVFLSIFSNRNQFPQLPSASFENKQVGFDLLNALSALFDLYQNGLLKSREPGAENFEVVFGGSEIIPTHIVLSETGERLFHLAGLAEINQFDQQEVVALFAAEVDDGTGVHVGKSSALLNK